MLKQLGITSLALAGLLGFAAPKKADAKVHFGVYVGGPAYSYPVAPVAPPYAYAPNYYNYPAPAYAQPYYAAPSYGYGVGIGGWGHDRDDHWRHEVREHDGRGWGGGHRDRR